MKTRLFLAVVLAATLTLTACSKKSEPTPAAPEKGDAAETTGVMDGMKQAAAEKMEQASEAVSQFAAEINLDKTVSDLKAEAAKMSVEDLQAVAAKYKDAIMEKQVDIDAIAEKLKAIPLTEKMGTDAQQLTGELKSLSESLKPLTDRFQVYVDAIKAKGGDLSALSVQ